MKMTRVLQDAKDFRGSLMRGDAERFGKAICGGAKNRTNTTCYRLIDPLCQRGASTTPLGKGAQSITATGNPQGLQVGFGVSGVAA